MFKKTITTTVYAKYISLGLGRGKTARILRLRVVSRAVLYIRLFEHSINSPLGECLYRFILSLQTHTQSVGKIYRCFNKPLRLQSIYAKYSSLGLGRGNKTRILRLRVVSDCCVRHQAFRALDEFALGRLPLSHYSSSNKTYTKQVSAKLIGVSRIYYGYRIPQIHLLGPWERNNRTYFTPSSGISLLGYTSGFSSAR